MARTSKKKLIVKEKLQPIIRIYKAAIYIRLSVEDNRKISADTVGTQKAELEDYIRTKADIQLYEIYEDINYTGTNYNRPGFAKMILDIEAGLADCVIVKDLSRFGRNFNETSNLLERVFPMLSIRFISANDNYDSLTATVDESGLIVPIKNLMNEIYARDCSKKVKAGYSVKKQRGEFCGSLAPYGYIKVGSSLVVDEETAPIVKKIYQWRIQGIGSTKICHMLNEMQIVPPSRYRFLKGITKSKKHENSLFWYKSAVKRILDNQTYTGVLPQGRYKSKFLKGGGVIETKKEDWIIIENAHPAIIDNDTFKAVQEINKRNKSEYANLSSNADISTDKGNIFKGIIFCGDCGKHMHRSQRKTKHTFACSIYVYSDKNACTMKPFKEAALRAAVFSVLHNEIKLAVDMSIIIAKLNKSKAQQNRKNIHDSKINEIKNKQRDIQGLIKILKKDCKSGLISNNDYSIVTEEFIKQYEQLQLEVENLTGEKQKKEKSLSVENKWIAEFKRFENEQRLTAEMLNALIQRIIVYDEARIELIMRYRDERELLYKYLKDYKSG